MKINYAVEHSLYSELNDIKKKTHRKEALAVFDHLVAANTKLIQSKPKQTNFKTEIETQLETFLCRYPFFSSTKGWTF